MKFENTQVYGFENAIYGLRLPMCKDFAEAKEKSDSVFVSEWWQIGDNDLRIIRNLIKADGNGKAGQPNSKFLRMIGVSVCITAPLCFWKELDTYKVGTVSNSTSTMHRIASYPITEDCFEKNPLTGKISGAIDIQKLEQLRQKFNETKDKGVWYDLIYGLGDSWLQTRMWSANYEVLRNIYAWRCKIPHKQNSWSGKDNPEMENMRSWIESLPYAKELICE